VEKTAFAGTTKKETELIFAGNVARAME